MKVFGKEKNLGDKAYNILKIYQNGFHIPNTIIIEKNQLLSFEVDSLQDQYEYILRPSFENEDTTIKSFAGFFKSIYPLRKKEVIKILRSNKINKIFGGKGYLLKSIIIQDFIETNIYGVYFTRNPNNIIKKGYYEIGLTNDEITSGNKKNHTKLNFFQKKELELIGTKLEKLFDLPQDIEFCIKNGKIIILQSRNITTGNNVIYNFSEIQKINGIYSKIEFDEFGENISIFSFSIINKISPCLYLGGKIYFKNHLINLGLLTIYKSNNNLLNDFINSYKKYLINKYNFSLMRKFIPMKLEKNVLEKIFIKYEYSFSLFEESHLRINFKYETNYLTKKYIELEKQKNSCFIILEKLKKEILKKNKYGKKINYLKIEEFFNEKINYTNIINRREKLKYSNFQNKLFFKNGNIINSINDENLDWIYKGKIKGKIVNLDSFQYKKNLNQILIIENLNLNLYDKLDFLDGVIIKNGNSLSHNSIILREYKIPSIINYNEFDKLESLKEIIL
ncbi:MAG: PEP/pyruvate-binding domain-containing protein [Candidatus Gracilibacteria bacterium]